VRALGEVTGLPLDAIRSVLAAVDDDTLSWHAAVRSAHIRLSSGTSTPSAESRTRVRELLHRHGWTLSGEGPDAEVLAQALDALAGLDHPVGDDMLDVYAEAAASIAEHDVAAVTAEDHVAAAAHVVVGTLLLEPALLAMRRIAQENVSAKTRG
jgi:hypothetical protein